MSAAPSAAPSVVDAIRQVARRRPLLANLISLELKVRYRRSVLGLLWTVVHPLLFMAVIWAVFGHFARGDEPNFPLFLLSGIMGWNLLHGAAMHALPSILKQEALLRKVALPKMIFPVAVATSELINFGFFLVAYVLLAGPSNVGLRLGLLALPLAVGMLLLYTVGLTLLFSSINVFFRDISHLSDVIFRFLFYLTPIVYPPQLLGDSSRWLELNPLYYPVQAVRHCVYYPDLGSPMLWVTGYVIGAFTCMLGFAVFLRTERSIIYYL